MNQEEAKALLLLYRPDGSDATDPRFAEALGLVERDPELREWFEAERAADIIIAAKLRAAPLPDDLLERVRTGTLARIAGEPCVDPDFGCADLFILLDTSNLERRYARHFMERAQ